MSQELAEGVWASTRVGMAATKEDAFNSFSLYGDNVKGAQWFRPLHEATDAICEIAHDPARFDEGVMRSIREYVKNLNRIKVREDNGHGKPVERFEPSSIAETWIRRAYGTKESEPIMLMETPVDGRGFALFVSYVMTNNELWPEDWEGEEEDPRVAMVDKFRNQSTPIAADGQAA